MRSKLIKPSAYFGIIFVCVCVCVYIYVCVCVCVCVCACTHAPMYMCE